MLSDLSELAAVVFMFIKSPILERIPVFRATPARWKPVVVSALALVVSAIVLWFRTGAGEGVSASGVSGAIWTALLGLIACTTGYTMMVVPFGDKASLEFLAGPADTEAISDDIKNKIYRAFCGEAEKIEKEMSSEIDSWRFVSKRADTSSNGDASAADTRS